MKKLLALLAFASVLTLAQTVTSPQTVDWRFALFWDDPNPAGIVDGWTVYASNSVSVRSYFTTTRMLDYDVLFKGQPLGVYAIWVEPRSGPTNTGPVSTNYFIKWTGRMQKPINLRSAK